MLVADDEVGTCVELVVLEDDDVQAVEVVDSEVELVLDDVEGLAEAAALLVDW